MHPLVEKFVSKDPDIVNILTMDAEQTFITQVINLLKQNGKVFKVFDAPGGVNLHARQCVDSIPENVSTVIASPLSYEIISRYCGDRIKKSLAPNFVIINHTIILVPGRDKGILLVRDVFATEEYVCLVPDSAPRFFAVSGYKLCSIDGRYTEEKTDIVGDEAVDFFKVLIPSLRKVISMNGPVATYVDKGVERVIEARVFKARTYDEIKKSFGVVNEIAVLSVSHRRDQHGNYMLIRFAILS